MEAVSLQNGWGSEGEEGRPPGPILQLRPEMLGSPPGQDQKSKAWTLHRDTQVRGPGTERAGLHGHASPGLAHAVAIEGL